MVHVLTVTLPLIYLSNIYPILPLFYLLQHVNECFISSIFIAEVDGAVSDVVEDRGSHGGN